MMAGRLHWIPGTSCLRDDENHNWGHAFSLFPNNGWAADWRPKGESVIDLGTFLGRVKAREVLTTKALAEGYEVPPHPEDRRVRRPPTPFPAAVTARELFDQLVELDASDLIAYRWMDYATPVNLRLERAILTVAQEKVRLCERALALRERLDAMDPNWRKIFGVDE